MPEWLLIILVIAGIFLLGIFFALLVFFKDLARLLFLGLFVFLLILLANRLFPFLENGLSSKAEITVNEIAPIILLFAIVVIVSSFYFGKTSINLKIRELLLVVEVSFHLSNEGEKRITLSNCKIQSKETIVSLKLLNKEIKEAIFTTTFFIAAGTLYSSLEASPVFKLIISPYSFWIAVAIIIIFVWSRLALLSYRIRKGFYGNNQYEARELISFIAKELNHLPPPNSGGQMKAFSSRADDKNAVWDDGLAGEGNQ